MRVLTRCRIREVSVLEKCPYYRGIRIKEVFHVRIKEISVYCLLSFSLIRERISQQAIAQLIGDPRYLRFNVLIREDAKVEPFTDVNVKVALSPQLF